jgi:hypothetical protein
MASVLLQAVLKRWGPDMTASACKFFTFTKFMASALLLAVLKRWGPSNYIIFRQIYKLPRRRVPFSYALPYPLPPCRNTSYKETGDPALLPAQVGGRWGHKKLEVRGEETNILYWSDSV